MIAHISCAHCKVLFIGTNSQLRHDRYDGSPSYCSAICRRAGRSAKAKEQAEREGRKLRKGVLHGPCKKCGKMFESKTDKIYCSLSCYTSSSQFLERPRTQPSAEARAAAAEQAKKGMDVPCKECGKIFYQKRSISKIGPKIFCSRPCYRSYTAKRFDRWIASPQGIALPQCYDEFLDGEILKCLIDSCGWEGAHLSAHMNLAHGVAAKEFKRAAGFNYSSGIVSKPVAIALRNRPLVGVAVCSNFPNGPISAGYAVTHAYKSLESREHQRKARAIASLAIGPERKCVGCGINFIQPCIYGKKLFCSLPCRDSTYRNRRNGIKPQDQAACASDQSASSDQGQIP